MAVTPKLRWLAIGFVVPFFAIGAGHWTIPYAQASVPNSLMGPGLVLVVVAAMAARLRGRASVPAATVVVGSAVPAAIMARVVVDTATDPTSHNLWPFELFLGGVLGYACSAAGALIANVVMIVARKR